MLQLRCHPPVRGLLALAGVLMVVSVPGALGVSATTLYVDGSSSACSDSGSGTQTQPFCTIRAAAAVVSAGQTVQVAAGTYPEVVNVPISGTAAAPIVFTAAPSATVTLPNQTNGFVSG